MFAAVIAMVTVTFSHGTHINVDKVYPFTDTNINQVLAKCNEEKTMYQSCLLRQQRDQNTLVFTDLKTYYQLVVNID